MNNFTQEELISIINVLNEAWGECNDSLQIKIQSMIDSYCEHQWIENQHYQSHCSKCGING